MVFTLCECGSELNNDDPFTVYDLQFYNNGVGDVLIVSLNGTHRFDKKINRCGNMGLDQFCNRIMAYYLINT